jgi:hypothetical protein
MDEKEQFKLLSQVQKLLIIMESGQLFLEKREKDQLTKLYLYKQFYVEIVYDLSTNKVLDIATPNTEDIVDKYMDVMTIEELLKM